jgi:hypothetical protein
LSLHASRVALKITLALHASLFMLNGSAGAATATADFLNVAPDSRSAALGGSGVADPDNGFAVFHNPALPAAADATLRVAAGQTQWLAGSQLSHYAADVRRADGDGAWALSASVSQWSGPDFQTTDSVGNITGRDSYRARTVGAGLSRSWGENISAGAAVKRLSQGFAGQVAASASGTAWDAGVFARGGDGRWTAGAVLQNEGAAAGLGGGRERLPATARAGLQWRPGSRQFAWTTEVSRSQDTGWTVAGGLGFSILPGFILRGGYDGRTAGSRYAGLTSGIGIAFKGFTFDYAFTPFGDLGNAQRISLAWTYGGRTAAPEPPRRQANRRAVSWTR